jgi:hypothetical protein
MADQKVFAYSPGVLGGVAVSGGLIVLILAVLPLPLPLVTVAVAALVCLTSINALSRGATYGGATAAAGLIGTTLSIVSLVIAGTFALNAPDKVDETPVTPPVDTSIGEETGETPVDPEVVRLQPDSVTATSSADSSEDANGKVVTFVADNVVDQDLATAWRTPGTGAGASLTFTFTQPVHLKSVGMVPGYAKVDAASGVDRFTENRRVEQARFDFGNGIVNEWAFLDSRDVQSNAVDVEVSSVTITVLASTKKADRDFTAISEVEFYGWVVN